MSKAESTQEFFEAQSHSMGINNQFNVFEREAFACRPMPYNRRDFYKISLLFGSSRLLYADKGVEINQPAFVFSNPLVPYAWEPVSDDQAGYFCLFTEDFLKVKDRDLVLQESPLFKLGSDPVFFVNPTQADYIGRIFKNMLQEFNTDYVHKYDLIRNFVNLLLHEAMKMQPSVSYFKHQNASERIVSMFMELLDRQFPVDSPQHALKLRTPNQYAEYLSVHVNHLNRSVREVTGQ